MERFLFASQAYLRLNTKKLNNRLALATVLAMLALSVFLDGLLPLEMPNSARELVFGTAVGAVEGGSSRGREIGLGESTSQPKVASATAGFGTQVNAQRRPPIALLSGTPVQVSSDLEEDYQPLYLRPVATVPMQVTTNAPNPPLSLLEIGGKGLGATKYPPLSTPEPAQRGNIERSKEASDGVVESGHSDPGVVVSAAGRAGSREGAGLAVRGIATYYAPSLAGGLMADNQTVYWPTQSGVVAATGYPIGTVLFTCGPSGRCLQLEVRDRGLLIPFTHLDVSSADFQVLSDRGLEPGVIQVLIREVE